MRAGKPRRSAIMMMNLNTSLMTQPLVTAWYWRRLPSAGKSCSCRATTSPTLFALIPSRLKSSGVRLVSKEARPACTSNELGIFCCNISIFYLVSHQVGDCDVLLPVLSKLGPMLADPSIKWLWVVFNFRSNPKLAQKIYFCKICFWYFSEEKSLCSHLQINVVILLVRVVEQSTINQGGKNYRSKALKKSIHHRIPSRDSQLHWLF